MRVFLGIALLAAFTATPLLTATADHGCNGTVTALGDLYIDDRGGGEVWVYQETNLEPGLQSGGTGPFHQPALFITHEDTCAHPNPDTIVF